MIKNAIEFFVGLLILWFVLTVLGQFVYSLPAQEGFFSLGFNLLLAFFPDPNQEVMIQIINFLRYGLWSGAYFFSYWKLR